MAMILSIIVPVYNVKEFLPKCMESLLDQDLSKDEYEIVLIDDGSTDGGGEICDDFALKEGNVKVVHQKNQGLSVARNVGTQVAEGKYIQYVDSDDYLHPGVLKGLVSLMEEHSLDVLRYGFRRVSERGSVPKVGNGPIRLKDNRIWEGKNFLLKELWFSCYACQFIIRKELLEVHHLQFKPGIIFEDTEWTPRLLSVSRRVASTDAVVYYYLIRRGSITNSAVEKRIKGQLFLIDELRNQALSMEDSRWYQGMISHMVVTIISNISKTLYPQRNVYLKELKDRNVYPLSTYMANKSGLRKIRLINVSPPLACFLIHLFNQ
ncbi:MAG: glycosyltransferase [Bacteroidales bacterium]|nr:glycosyltransferase [Bacteroidales bacterium]